MINVVSINGYHQYLSHTEYNYVNYDNHDSCGYWK